MKKIIGIVITAVMLLCCASANQAEPTLIGRWSWVKSKFITRGMPQAKISTPKSRGYVVDLVIGLKEIEIVKDEKSVATVPYLLYQQGEELHVLRVSIPQDDFPFYISSGPVYFKSDTLIIAGTYNDAGEDQYFVRVKE